MTNMSNCVESVKYVVGYATMNRRKEFQMNIMSMQNTEWAVGSQ